MINETVAEPTVAENNTDLRVAFDKITKNRNRPVTIVFNTGNKDSTYSAIVSIKTCIELVEQNELAILSITLNDLVWLPVVGKFIPIVNYKSTKRE